MTRRSIENVIKVFILALVVVFCWTVSLVLKQMGII
jgi:hypothetical protein